MIGVKDRWIAMIGCFAAGALAVGAKASGPVLAIWTLVVLAGIAIGRPIDRTIVRQWLTPAAPVVMLLLLAGFAILSGVWAHNPIAAVDAGVTLGVAILAGHVLDRGLNQLSPSASTLVAGWFVIGLTGGGLILLSEFLTNFAVTEWILTSVPKFRPENNMMIAESKDRLYLDRAMGNWSVATVNFMAWPAVLAMSAIAKGSARWLIALALLALVLAITLHSDHQTSQVALMASVAIFVAAYFAPAVMRKAALVMSLLLIFSVVPLTYGVNRVAHLQEASWAQYSLKERFRIWSNVSEHYMQAPLLGIGANNTTIIETNNAAPRANKQDIKPKHHPHNMILQIWLELGAVGAVLLALACVSLFRALDHIPSRILPYVLATGTTVAVQVSATWSLWSTWFLCAVAMAMSFLFLCVRVARNAELPQAQSFAEVWLPQTLRAKLRSETTV